MFSKLVVLILTIGAVAATLLAARQQRLQAVHETAEAMRRIAEHDRTLWRLRSEIAERVTPGKVRRLATDRFGPLAYLGDRFSPLRRGDDEGGEIHNASLVAPDGPDGPDEAVHSDWGDAAPEGPGSASAEPGEEE